jgi:hypothetical protein
MGGMNNELSRLWWLPSVLLLLAGVLCLIAASYWSAPFWFTFAGILFGFAGLSYWRRQGTK